MWGIFSVVIHHLQSAAFSERKTWTDASILTVYFIESFVDIAQHSVEKLQIWGLLQAWMRELFSYVVPDWIKMVMEVMRWGLHCFVSGWWAHFVFLFFWEAACSVGGAKVTTRQLSRPVGSSSGCGCGRLVQWMGCTARTLLSTRRTTQFSPLFGFKWKLSRFKVTVQKTPAEIVCAAEAVGFWGFSALYTFAMNALKTNFNFSFQSKEDSVDYFVSHFNL